MINIRHVFRRHRHRQCFFYTLWEWEKSTFIIENSIFILRKSGIRERRGKCDTWQIDNLWMRLMIFVEKLCEIPPDDIVWHWTLLILMEKREESLSHADFQWHTQLSSSVGHCRWRILLFVRRGLSRSSWGVHEALQHIVIDFFHWVDEPTTKCDKSPFEETSVDRSTS